MKNGTFQSWGAFPPVVQRPVGVSRPASNLFTEIPGPTTVLPFGQGRSYGDCCLNGAGCILVTTTLDRILDFDQETGIVRCEAGTTLQALLNFCVPRGWFLPVVPGTRFVSVGGAIANDVHGKNHHQAGTFGRHLIRFELLKSDGNRLICSRDEHPEVFAATIAGLGLTGLILWADVALQPIDGPFIDMESIKFRDLEEFFAVSADSKLWKYTVAWLDCVSSGPAFGRGIFMRGRHSPVASSSSQALELPWFSFPFNAPGFCLNSLSVRAFNTLYYHKQRAREVKKQVHFVPFFFPLDAIGRWNRIYGRRGFLQFQCVIPPDPDHRAVRELLRAVVRSGRASFLAVMKEFGDLGSPGILSFPRPGVTLCLDFKFEGDATRALMNRLEEIVVKTGGALYPAKDAVMSMETFRRSYPRWEEFSRFIDPRFSSDFWRRVAGASERPDA